ncbi:TonB-dependent receptor plug domain-containing protein [Rhizorhabdus histidinilytica]
MGGTPLPKARLGAGLLRAAAPVALIAAGMTPSTAIAQSASAATGSGTIEEIVVTAQKERSTLQKTAAAITALSGDALLATGVTDIRAAQAYVPSVRFQQQGAATEVYIRGVGSSIDSPQYEPPTSVHFNGVYVPRNATGGASTTSNGSRSCPGHRARSTAAARWAAPSRSSPSARPGISVASRWSRAGTTPSRMSAPR